MQHFIDVTQLSETEALALFDRAFAFKKAETYPDYSNTNVLNLFYEKSTRTSLSFELAQKKLGCISMQLYPERSAEGKGETMIDTLQTIAAMGINIAVIRHPENDIFETLKPHVPKSLSLVNAGSGAHAHPTQAMLDMMTIVEKGLEPKNIKIAVVGDILHSRVASSFTRLCKLMDVGELVFAGPSFWLPETVEYGRVTDDLGDALKDADVVMTLRVQNERIEASEIMDLAGYHTNYCITEAALRSAKPEVLVMHPGPMNRGIEIDGDVADGSRSCILTQVGNGVFIRMAILEALIN